MADRAALTFAKESVFASIQWPDGTWRVTDFYAPTKGIEQGRFAVWRKSPLQLITPRTLRVWQVPTFADPRIRSATAFSRPKMQWDARVIERDGIRYLLLAGEEGLLVGEDISGTPDITGGLSIRWLGSAPLSSIADLAWVSFRAVEVIGSLAWVLLGRSKHLAGIAAFDISDLRRTPLPLVYVQSWVPFTASGHGFWEHGNMSNLAQHAGRVYAGAGRGGIREFDGASPAPIAAYFENVVTVTSVAIRPDGLGAFTHYWQPDPPLPRPYQQGVHFFDCRVRGGLERVGEWPGGGGTEAWTVREHEGKFVATSLYNSRSLRVEVS